MTNPKIPEWFQAAEIKNPPKYYQKFQRPRNQRKRRKGKDKK